MTARSDALWVISDAILERAKALARKESTTRRALIEEGLEVVLKRRRAEKSYKLHEPRT